MDEQLLNELLPEFPNVQEIAEEILNDEVFYQQHLISLN
jgi:hypothetical protein